VAKPTPVNPNLDATAHAYDAAGLSTSATPLSCADQVGRCYRRTTRSWAAASVS